MEIPYEVTVRGNRDGLVSFKIAVQGQPDGGLARLRCRSTRTRFC